MKKVKEVSNQSETSQVFWNIPADELLTSLGTSLQGLPRKEAAQRLLQSGSQITGTHIKTSEIKLFLSQFKSPVILLLLFAASLSFVLADAVDTIIILIIVFVSGALGFWQERGAVNALHRGALCILRRDYKGLVLQEEGKCPLKSTDNLVEPKVHVFAFAIIPSICVLADGRI